MGYLHINALQPQPQPGGKPLPIVVVVDGGGGRQGGHEGTLAASVARVTSRTEMRVIFMFPVETAGIFIYCKDGLIS